jgi:putative transposase
MGLKVLPMTEKGVLTLSDTAWAQAQLRNEVITLLAQQNILGKYAVNEAAQQLGLSTRQVYKLVHRFRKGEGLVTDMASDPPRGGKGKGRLSEPVEQIIQNILFKRYLTRQKRSEVVIWREIIQSCRDLGLKKPALNTVRARIRQLDPRVVIRKREGSNAERKLQSAGGKPPEIIAPLDQVQIDHTVIDLIIVDHVNRQPIGRPYLTVAIDVYSRCLVGMVVTLEAPSATSVGLCLAHVVCDKRHWLEQMNLNVSWKMSGKPESLYLDNAAEFKSEALRRGCTQHGIQLNYRPLGQPHYGGIIERVIGTAMQRIHELPGTTFSNPSQRGNYNSDKQAVLTLSELESWLTLAVATYHGTVHSTLNKPPAIRWAEGIAQFTGPVIVTQQRAFLIDFLPVLRRTLCRTGFLIDHVTYYADALKVWIAKRDQLNKFIIRRDPRDISHVWVLDPEGKQYLEIPYRTLSHPTVTLWEHKKAVEKLREQGRAQVDETSLFRMISQMREITQTAERTTRKSRREAQRRAHLIKMKENAVLSPPVNSPVEETSYSVPFEQIEEW